jgi:tryptophanyl-tRNA synthetase|tara:strand:+ start:111 stop:1094 length:984 start_codon:yes stop_codon:yes gene_type:complete
VKKRVFSGVKPSARLHIGNYIGAIRNWVGSIDDRENIFCVVDQHAITVDHDPEELRTLTRELIGLYIACGLDPQKANIFIQSHIPEHTELAWILNCITPVGWLERMTQFKDKAGSLRERVSTGLFTYPTLMAADILLYGVQEVPVGEDQKQHVELTRDIAERFNRKFGDVFTIPEPIIHQVGARIMGLDDPTRKMSKSAEGRFHSIDLLDEPSKIKKTVMRAVTDSLGEIVFDRERPGVYNLLIIFEALTGWNREQIEAHFSGKGYGDLKKGVAEVLIAELEPIQARYLELSRDVSYLDDVLADSVQNLRPFVDETMQAVRYSIGMR